MRRVHDELDVDVVVDFDEGDVEDAGPQHQPVGVVAVLTAIRHCIS